MTGLSRNGTIPKSKPKFKVGDNLECWINGTPAGKVTERYYMDWTLSNPSGGWYYNTTIALGQGEGILRKETAGSK